MKIRMENKPAKLIDAPVVENSATQQNVAIQIKRMPNGREGSLNAKRTSLNNDISEIKQDQSMD